VLRERFAETSKHRQNDPKRRKHQDLACTPSSVDEVRPSHCLGCSGPSRPVGEPLRVVGHGARERDVYGVLTLGAAPVVTSVSCRRYRCACGCVMLVGPCDLAPSRRFTLFTIALALLRLAAGTSPTQIRAELAPGRSFEEGWASLRRWALAVAEGRLFRWIRGVSELAGRALAVRVSAVLAEGSGLDARQASPEERVFAGVMLSSAI
jgi:hypothetical protein